MILEIGMTLALLVGGAATMRAAGLRGWGLLPWGYLAGLAIYVLTGSLLVVLHVPAAPLFALAATALLGVGVWLWRIRAGGDARVNGRAVAGGLAGAAALTALLRASGLVTWHVDSLVYTNLGQAIAAGHYVESVGSYSLSKRLLTVPLMHAPSFYNDEFYVRSITPLVALATAGVLAWLVMRACPPEWRRWSGLAGASAALLLLTVPRMMLHAFYVNGHLVTGTVVMAVTGATWLLATRRAVPRTALLVAVALLLPVVVLTRAEGAILAGIVALPWLVLEGTRRGERAVVLASIGVPATAYYTLATIELLGEETIEAGGEGAPAAYVIGLAIGLAALAAAVVAMRVDAPAWLRWMPQAGEIGAWLLLVALVALKGTEVLTASVRAAFWSIDPIDGAWGVTIDILALAVLVLWIATRIPMVTVLRYSVTTFVPLALLLAYGRDGAYRMAGADSLHRMIAQIVPTLVLAAVVAACVAIPRWRERTRATADAEAGASS
ncbi:hypothetical protein [Demequina rhizosphaerae]|uniref:hypothetical protein n=1 Tax=Demequina rhizosphaerae TaxID=1638985 RepID=UPI000784AE0F|nr:hypothetical protein [Demequina rhizosphaerae]